MKEILVTNWGWITYVVMLVVPFLVGLLTKATWHSLIKFGLLVVLAGAAGVVNMEVADLPWEAANVGPFILSLIGTAEVYYFAFIKSFPAVQNYLDSHVVK